ncbi:MAG: hypothetical protein WC578_03760 [Candidatus Omnitrophota bacterium]
MMDDDILWNNYALTIKELKRRKLIRTRNISGERGEHLAIEIYNATPREPNLQAAPEGTQNVDALSRKGERYAIKTVTLPHKLTGVFYGFHPPDSKEPEEKKFEYLVIVVINDLLEPVKILECGWDTFLKYKRWHKTMRAWNISVTEKLEKESRIIFPKNEGK